jgi:hypothetical protein
MAPKDTNAPGVPPDEKSPLLPKVRALPNFPSPPRPHLIASQQPPIIHADDETTIPKKLWQRYSDLIDRRPLITKAITATILFLLADLIAQGIEHLLGRVPIDQDVDSSTTNDMIVCGINVPRVARFAAFGLIGAPWSHYYFQYLDRWLPPSEQPWTVRTFTKVIIDQFIQAPLLLAIMIGALSLMKGEGFRGVSHALHDNFRATLIANCMFFSLSKTLINLRLAFSLLLVVCWC